MYFKITKFKKCWLTIYPQLIHLIFYVRSLKTRIAFSPDKMVCRNKNWTASIARFSTWKLGLYKSSASWWRIKPFSSHWWSEKLRKTDSNQAILRFVLVRPNVKCMTSRPSNQRVTLFCTVGLTRSYVLWGCSSCQPALNTLCNANTD